MALRAFWLLLLIGCNSSFAGLFDDEEARRQIATQQTSIGNLRTQSQALDARVVKLEELLSNQPLLELNNQIEALRLDLNKLQGQIEVLANENESTQKRQKDFYIDLDTRLRRLEQPAGSPASEAVSLAPGPGGPGTSAEAHTEAPAAAAMPPAAADTGATAGESGESRAYESAYNLFKTARYQDAVSQFNKFLKNYPRSSLAPSAQYWIGNSHYALRDFKNAISAQEKLISAFPDSTKAPDAMLNIASSQQEMNKKPAAKKTLENIIRKYPGSDAADKARHRLASLK
ncbi:MAG: tol-pal system protein YbgF [Betaproteobacteria bacterium]|nr:tol-pal system protein YbgF [Betaproteobacteria bacterium]